MEGNGKIGVFWHTQGSGKSLSMVFYAHQLVQRDVYKRQVFADTFYDDQHPTLKADYILANPPFNLSDWGQSALQEDVRWQYGLPPAGNANFAWMQHMIHHLAPNGKIGLVLANGALSSQSGGEGQIRQAIIEADLVEGIVALPSQLFYSTGIPVSLWFISRNKAQKGKITRSASK